MEKDKKYIDLIKKNENIQALREYYNDHNCSPDEASSYINMLIKKVKMEREQGNQEIQEIQENREVDDEKYIQLIESGARLQAVSEYANDTKCGLKEAKDYIDKLAESIYSEPEELDEVEDTDDEDYEEDSEESDDSESENSNFQEEQPEGKNLLTNAPARKGCLILIGVIILIFWIIF